MPKTPITYREIFFAEVRGSKDPATGTPLLKELEWDRVETELGTMVEPRINTIDAAGRVVNADMTDTGVSKISIINDEGVFQNQFGTGGSGLVDYNA